VSPRLFLLLFAALFAVVAWQTMLYPADFLTLSDVWAVVALVAAGSCFHAAVRPSRLIVALAGAMVPAAGHKGSALALLVDIMSGGVAGSHFSFEASGFGGTAGGPPDVGQVLLAIDPTATMGPGFVDRIETELQALAAEDGARLPGDARLASRRRTAQHGVEVPADLMALLTEYAEHGSPAVSDD
jgi:(2R)-3-sulfolactate dehydrogenase (NADP+)